MYWVLQNNLYSEKGFKSLVGALERLGISHEIVKVVPFSHELIPDINPINPIMAVGAYTMGEIAKERNWNPGVFINDNFRYEVWKEHYGKHLLNHNAHVKTFAEMSDWMGDLTSTFQGDSAFFFRPCEDSKKFAGTVFTASDFWEWGKKVKALGEDSEIKPDMMIMMSELQDIYKEYRFFVVGGKVVTGSLYKEGTRVIGRECDEEFVINYAQEMVDIWCPDIAFVIDIAIVSDGMRVIEINSLNSSGFYACDMQKVVVAIEELTDRYS